MSSADWKERIAAGEAESFERLAETLQAIKRRRADGDPSDRSLHAKANAGLAAELHVSPDVPEALRVGIFAKPAKYRAYARYSNGSGTKAHDKKGDVRALSFKVLGVPGKKLIPGLEDASTQDFLLIRSPTVPTRTAAEFTALVHAAEKPPLIFFRLLVAVGFVRTLQILGAAARSLGAPVLPIAATTYYSVLPIMWGTHAVKLSLAPHDTAPSSLPSRRSGTALGDELAERIKSSAVVYDLRAQLFVDEKSTPIEDPSVEWTEAVSPPQKIAELILSKQELGSDAGKKRAAFIENLSFDPWHAPVEFRPLGELMRARNVAYRVSTMDRRAAPEPDGTERFD